MPGFNDLTGQTINGITFFEIAGRNNNKKIVWKVRCHCGKFFETVGSSVKRGHTSSCGCSRKGHGGQYTRLYSIWQSMKSRCYYNKNKNYKYYGGRGIIVCDIWKDSFQEFESWALNNGYSDELTIDRINTNKDYTPDNCRWTTPEKQAINRRTQSNNTSGHRGVVRSECGKRWRAQIHSKGKGYNLGTFANLEDAVRARIDAELQFWGYSTTLKSVGVIVDLPQNQSKE